MEEVRKTWETDSNLQQLIAELTKDANSHPNYLWTNNILIRKGKVVVGQVPSLQRQIISLYHDSTVGGHSGAAVTSKKSGQMFYWKKLQKLVRQYVRECPICQQNKSENVKPPGLLQPLPIPYAPFIDISMDFIDGLLKSFCLLV